MRPEDMGAGGHEVLGEKMFLYVYNEIKIINIERKCI